MSDIITEIPIRGKKIPAKRLYLDISTLNYFSKNPRIGSLIFNEKIQDDKERQKFIHEKMIQEANVHDLVKRIKVHKDLIEPIIVRNDTMEVIEGNSRLAAYRILYKDGKNEEWKNIKCDVIEKLDASLQRSLLSEFHMKGKDKWKKYEKAYWVYDNLYNEDCPLEQLCLDIDESKAEILKLVDMIKLMKESNDSNRNNFSYYEIIRRNSSIHSEILGDVNFKEYIFSGIKNGEFQQALNLRYNLPNIISKKKILAKLIKGEIDFDDAADSARPPKTKKIILNAMDKLKKLTKREIESMTQNEINDSALQLKKLKREVERIDNSLKEKGA